MKPNPLTLHLTARYLRSASSGFISPGQRQQGSCLSRSRKTSSSNTWLPGKVLSPSKRAFVILFPDSRAFRRQRIFAQRRPEFRFRFRRRSIKACEPASMATGFSLDGQSRIASSSVELLDAVVTDFGDQKTEQTGQIVFLFLQDKPSPPDSNTSRAGSATTRWSNCTSRSSSQATALHRG